MCPPTTIAVIASYNLPYVSSHVHCRRTNLTSFCPFTPSPSPSLHRMKLLAAASTAAAARPADHGMEEAAAAAMAAELAWPEASAASQEDTGGKPLSHHGAVPMPPSHPFLLHPLSESMSRELLQSLAETRKRQRVAGPPSPQPPSSTHSQAPGPGLPSQQYTNKGATGGPQQLGKLAKSAARVASAKPSAAMPSTTHAPAAPAKSSAPSSGIDAVKKARKLVSKDGKKKMKERKKEKKTKKKKKAGSSVPGLGSNFFL